jgi:hypothetical protein
VTFLSAGFHVLRHEGSAVDGAVAAVGGAGNQIGFCRVCDQGIGGEGGAFLPLIGHADQLNAVLGIRDFLVKKCNFMIRDSTHSFIPFQITG